MSADDETRRLADYILAHCPLEIGRPASAHGESAVDVAIRLLGRMAGGIDNALHELGMPDESYPAPVANSVEALRNALGLWGKT